MKEKKKIAIIGGGIAGLTFARLLTTKDYEIHIFRYAAVQPIICVPLRRENQRDQRVLSTTGLRHLRETLYVVKNPEF